MQDVAQRAMGIVTARFRAGRRQRRNSVVGERPAVEGSASNHTLKREAAEILKDAPELPTEARAALAGSLLESLDTEVSEDAEAAWATEQSISVASRYMEPRRRAKAPFDGGAKAARGAARLAAGPRRSRSNQDARRKATVRAARFGRAVLFACIHESAKQERVVSESGVVHQSVLRRARSGSANPARSSISEKVRTTASAYRSSRYL